jgi:hypothetical protein
MTVDGKKFISLKEAAELSGYTQDYLGQLIRNGKLPGKKVYVNVAWMTTEEDLRKYLHEKASGNGTNGNGNGNGNGHSKKNGNGGSGNGGRRSAFQRAAKPALFFFSGVLTAVVLVLFYVFAVNLDSKLDRQAIDDMDLEAQLLAPATPEDELPEGENPELLMVTPEGNLLQL